MVHDRQVNGETLVFGNQGALFMNAMTWWDHKTNSVWSQVWGQAIAGSLKGTTLELVPASIVPWGTWKNEHPGTLAMTTGKFNNIPQEERPRDSWVVGITLGEFAKAYPYLDLAEAQILNDMIASYPLLLYTNPETRNIKVYLRQIDDQALTFHLTGDGQITDDQTGTVWDPQRGLAIEGTLKGQALLHVPYISSFDWAWLDFHPDSEFYE
jgi:hypothetical protein